MLLRYALSYHSPWSYSWSFCCPIIVPRQRRKAIKPAIHYWLFCCVSLRSSMAPETTRWCVDSATKCCTDADIVNVIQAGNVFRNTVFRRLRDRTLEPENSKQCLLWYAASLCLSATAEILREKFTIKLLLLIFCVTAHATNHSSTKRLTLTKTNHYTNALQKLNY